MKMAFDVSRRFLMAGGLATASLAGCATTAAETQGAFPVTATPDPYLLGPKEGVALLSRNENPYGPSKAALKMVEYAANKGASYTSP